MQQCAVWSDDGVQFRATDLTAFNPDVHVSAETADSIILAWCQVDAFRSNNHKTNVQR